MGVGGRGRVCVVQGDKGLRGWEGHSVGERTRDAENGGVDGWMGGVGEWGVPLL